MPLYEYKCNSCGKNFEVLQKFSAAPLEIHAECGGGPVDRLISPPAFQFKGTGWYVTDYAKGSGSGPAKGGESSKDSKESKAETTSESKSSDSGSSGSSSASSASSGESKSSGSASDSPSK